MDWLTGTAQWVFKDISTPVRPDNPVPYVNQKGVIERDFTKKDAYYVFQSYWSEQPMVPNPEVIRNYFANMKIELLAARYSEPSII